MVKNIYSKINLQSPVVRAIIISIFSVIGFIGSFVFYRVYDMPQVYETVEHNQMLHNKQDAAQKRLEDKLDNGMNRISDQIQDINRYLRDKLK